MRPLLPLLILLFTAALYGVPSIVNAETVLDAGGVIIKSDIMTHDQEMNIIHASGAVHIEWQGMSMMAIETALDIKSQVITATGNVVLIKGGDIVRGDRLTLDTVSGRGEIDNAVMFLRQGNNFHITGKRVRKTGEGDYELTQGSFTTCDTATPSWKFEADQMDMTVEEFATAKNVIFYVKDIPVFYFPYLIYPVKRERQSGFLFPRLGQSAKKGAEVDLPYYWAISPNQEATIDLDLQSKRGVGTGLDYRYLNKQGSTGTFGGYLIYDKQDERWRGQMSQTHKEVFSPDMNLRTSINLTTDRNFLTDYGEKAGEYNRQSNDSTVNFLKTWQHYALTANLRYTEDYYSTTDGGTLQTLPEIGLAAVRQQVFNTPVYFDMDAGIANFYRENGPSGQRLETFPRLTLMSGLPGYLHASAYAGIHLRAYNTGNIPTGSSVKSNDADMMPEAGASVSTSFSKIYEVDGANLKKLRHELTPELSYVYSAERDQTRFPLYDNNDRLASQNILYYSLTSQLGGKFQIGETTEYRNISHVKLTQGYGIAGTRRDLLTLVDANRPWTDVILETETLLHPRARLTFNARYNVYDTFISSTAPGLELNNLMGTTAGVSYHMIRNEVEYMEGRFSTKYMKPWTLGYTGRYSFDRGNFLESVYSAEYRHQCWSLLFSFRERTGNQAFMINFNIGGLSDGGFSAKDR